MIYLWLSYLFRDEQRLTLGEFVDDIVYFKPLIKHEKGHQSTSNIELGLN
jgi:hypothetical protein